MAHRNEEEDAPRPLCQEPTLRPAFQVFPPQMKTKFCTLCRYTKAIYLFGRSRLSKDSYSRVCAACQKKRKRKPRTGKPRGYAWRGTLHLPSSPD